MLPQKSAQFGRPSISLQERSMHHLRYGLFAVLATACGTETSQSPDISQPHITSTPRFQIERLSGGAGGNNSRGQSINVWGTVAGFSSLADGSRHAALWRHGEFKDLKTLGGPN